MRFENSDTKKSALAMYSYYLRLIKLKRVTQNSGEGDEEFASRVARNIAGVSANELKKFTKTALKARFGKEAPEEREAEQMQIFIKNISDII